MFNKSNIEHFLMNLWKYEKWICNASITEDIFAIQLLQKYNF